MKKLLIFFSLFMVFTAFSQQKRKDYSKIMKSQNIYEIDAFLRDAHPDDGRRSILKPRLLNLLEEYIKNANPGDPRVEVMQDKLAMLKKRPSTRISFDEMTSIIKQKQIKRAQEDLANARLALQNPKPTPKTADQDKETPEDNSPSVALRKPNNQYASNTNVRATTKPTTTSYKTSSSTINPEQAEFDLLMNPSAEEHKNKTVKVLNALFDNDPTSKETTVLIKNNSDCDIIMRIDGTGYTKYRLAIPAKGENTIVIIKGSYLFSSLVCGAQYASQKTVEKSIMVSLGK